MPQAKYGGIDFPYVEGLRLDEAMKPNSLFFAFGMYGDNLPPQDGAPVRMVIPWKYGYKSIKSLVKIRFQEKGASYYLESLFSRRIRLLLQRQSQR